MLEWMIKGKPLEEYLQACRNADLTTVETDAVLMRMFNTPEAYQLHLENMVKHFGSLDRMRICEIGGGYGGQCKAVFGRFTPNCYHIIDLPEVCELQVRYCRDLLMRSTTKPTGQDYDLVISNYALSEIPDNKLYIDEVVKRSKHGYITCNTDLVQLDFPHSRHPDIKGERETNYILIW